MHDHGLVAELNERLGERQGLDGVAQWLVAGCVMLGLWWVVPPPPPSPHFASMAMVGCRAEDCLAA
jgi:hypothetical protein